MACAARPIEYKNVTVQFSEHTFMKNVETQLNSRFNMLKDLCFTFLPSPPPATDIQAQDIYRGRLQWPVCSCGFVTANATRRSFEL